MEFLRSYDHHLRAIGQSLESKRITAFEVKAQGESYLVRGTPEKTESLLGRLRNWRERMTKGSPADDVTYEIGELDRLEQEGRSQRAKAGRLPDFYSLPNTLRTLGCYLNAKDAELLELHKNPLSVTLLYKTRDGHPNMEERSVASFYNFFVNLHGRRNKRASH
jgi:hypothetical protein